MFSTIRAFQALDATPYDDTTFTGNVFADFSHDAASEWPTFSSERRRKKGLKDGVVFSGKASTPTSQPKPVPFGCRYSDQFHVEQIEGEPDKVWEVIRGAFEAALASGADKELMFIKVYQGEHDIESLETRGRKVASESAK